MDEKDSIRDSRMGKESPVIIENLSVTYRN